MLCLLLCKQGDKLIDREQKIKVKINARNITHYLNLGYKEVEKGNCIDVFVKDLPLNSREKINVQCDICGATRDLEYRMYMKNIDRNNGIYTCQSCSVQVCHNKKLESRQTDYYDRLSKKCTQKGYKLLSDKTEFKCNTSYVRYECPLHGEQRMRINNLLNDRECPRCADDIRKNKYRLSSKEVVQRVNECGGTLLNPEDYVNNSTYNLKFKCQNCGSIFTSSFQRFTQHGGQLCRNCSGSESVGEMKIRHYLDENNIDYRQEHWFKDCRDVHPLPFDFYLPELSTIIEFDGRQHFQETDYFSYTLEKTKQHDAIKEQYCKDNGLNLIRIPYTKINHINSILDEQLVT